MLKISKLLGGPSNFDLDGGGTKHYLMHSLLTGLYPSFFAFFWQGGTLGTPSMHHYLIYSLPAVNPIKSKKTFSSVVMPCEVDDFTACHTQICPEKQCLSKAHFISAKFTDSQLKYQHVVTLNYPRATMIPFIKINSPVFSSSDYFEVTKHNELRLLNSVSASMHATEQTH